MKKYFLSAICAIVVCSCTDSRAVDARMPHDGGTEYADVGRLIGCTSSTAIPWVDAFAPVSEGWLRVRSWGDGIVRADLVRAPGRDGFPPWRAFETPDDSATDVRGRIRPVYGHQYFVDAELTFDHARVRVWGAFSAVAGCPN